MLRKNYLYPLLLLLTWTLQGSGLPGCPSLKNVDESASYVNEDSFELPVCYCDWDGTEARDKSGEKLIELSCLYGSKPQNLSSAVAAVRNASRTISKISINHMEFENGFDASAAIFKNAPLASEVALEINTCFVGDSHNNLMVVEDGTFDGLENNLVSLVVTDCKMKVVPKEFKKMKKLKSLRLSVDLGELAAEQLEGFENVQNLDLQGNDLTQLPEDAFAGVAEQLQFLTLGPSNKFDGTVFPALQQLKRLETLEMISCLEKDDNQRSQLKDNSFSGMATMEKLVLRGNGLNEIELDALKGLSGLKTLDLRINSMSEFIPGVFEPLISLEELMLAGNYFSTINATQFNGLANLKKLDLGYHDMPGIEDNAFSTLTSLEELDLRSGVEYVRLANISDNAFAGLSELKILNLTNAQLGKIKPVVLRPLSKLESLDLTNAQIVQLDDPALFQSTPRLKQLDLDDNALRTVNGNLFQPLVQLQELDLSGNPWLCDDKLKPAWQFINSAAEFSSDFMLRNNENTMCDRPLVYRDLEVMQLNDTNFQPYDPALDTTTTPPTTTPAPTPEPVTVDFDTLFGKGGGVNDGDDGGSSSWVLILIIVLLILTAVVVGGVLMYRKRKQQQDKVQDAEMQPTQHKVDNGELSNGHAANGTNGDVKETVIGNGQPSDIIENVPDKS